MNRFERETLEARLSMLASRIRGRGKGPRPAEADCLICGNVCTGLRLHRDHDHSNGRFRGWLCRACNLGLGRFKDSPAMLRRAALYLETRVDPEPEIPIESSLSSPELMVGTVTRYLADRSGYLKRVA